MEHRKPRAAVGSIAAALVVSAMLPAGLAFATHDESPKDAEFYKLQWNLKAISAHAAFSTEAEADGSTDVLVAVLDTGIDYLHPDLDGRVNLALSESLIGNRAAVGSKCTTKAHPHEPDLQEGLPEPGSPYGAVRTGMRGDTIEEEATAIGAGREKITDFHSHGTAVSGLIASNGLHLAGVTQDTTLISVKVHGMGRQNCLTTYIRAIYMAADKGADVIHLSYPLEWNVDAVEDPDVDGDAAVTRVNEALEYAHDQGAVIVAAAGNGLNGVATDLDADPAQFRFCEGTHVICVGATGTNSADLVEEDHWDRIAAYSNFGSDIDVAGPGGTTAVPVTLTCSQVTVFAQPPQAPCRQAPKLVWRSTGTSFGAAATSGLAALIVRLTGSDDPCVIEGILEGSADDLGDLGRDDYYGDGRINVKQAVGVAGRLTWEAQCD
jgi:subtilisin family serine protease